MNIKIYTMTHQSFDVPTDSMYVPLQVGRATHADLSYLCDNSGDNISNLNCYYSELTGVYWVWKNCHDADYVGVCHYRRYLLNDLGYIFTKPELEALFQSYDILTSKKLTLNFSYAYGFGENHAPEDLEATGAVIQRLYPDYYPLYEQRVHENHTYFGNIMICSKATYDAYCSWLFPIFFELQTILDLDSYDDYHKRLYGFISEFLLMIWVEHQHLRVKECKVGIIGAKKETTDVKNTLAVYFKKKDYIHAKEYFLSVRAKRPDILMEASDINRELHLSLQVIATCEEDPILLDYHSEFNELMDYMNQLNSAILRLKAHESTPADHAFLNQSDVFSAAIKISILLHSTSPAEQNMVLDQLAFLLQDKAKYHALQSYFI